MRCLVLNADYSFVSIIKNPMKAISKVIKGKAISVKDYDRILRGQSRSIAIPAVIVLTDKVDTSRSPPLFDRPTMPVIWARDGGICAYCQQRVIRNNKRSWLYATRDHVVPVSQDGPNRMENVVLACSGCNSAKCDKTPLQAGMPLKIKPRRLTEEEKIVLVLRSVKTEERKSWLSYLNENGLSLYTTQQRQRKAS